MSTTIDATTRLMTADELLTMPHSEYGNDYRFELVKGELKKMSPTKPMHGIVTARLTVAVGQHVEAEDLGEVFGAETGFLVERDPDTVLAADVAFVTHERLATIENIEKFMPFAPDVAVEVLSPSNTVDEIDDKIAAYFAAGTRLVWVANHRRRTLKVYRSTNDILILGETDTLDGGDVLPGFSYSLAKLFTIGRRR